MQQSAPEHSSTRPYLIRAIYDWCTDNGLTPYLAVHVDESVKVPLEHVKNNEIVLNVSYDATSALKLGNEIIEFKARFSGSPRDISFPVDHVIAIYARENGQGMSFPAPPIVNSPSAEILNIASEPHAAQESDAPESSSVAIMKLVTSDKPEDTPPEGPKPGPRPALKRVK